MATNAVTGAPHATTRRDFMLIATAAGGAVGAAALVWPFVSSMAPDQMTIAAGAPVGNGLGKVGARP